MTTRHFTLTRRKRILTQITFNSDQKWLLFYIFRGGSQPPGRSAEATTDRAPALCSLKTFRGGAQPPGRSTEATADRAPALCSLKTFRGGPQPSGKPAVASENRAPALCTLKKFLCFLHTLSANFPHCALFKISGHVCTTGH